MSFKDSQKNQWFLFFGILILVGTIFVSFWSVIKLEKLTVTHQKTLTITSKIDEIERLINEFAIQTKNKKNSNFPEAADFIQNKFAETEKFISNNQEKIKLLSDAKEIWDKAYKNKEDIGISELTHLDKIFTKIDRNEMDKIQARDPEIILTVNQLMSTMIFLCALSLLVIGYALRAIQKENKIKKQFMEELMESRKSAEEASHMKSKFLATVSHELRTPLNGIIGLSDVLTRSDLPIKEKKLVQAISSSGKTLLRIINDILDFTKIESGIITMESRSFIIKDVFNQIIETLSEKVKEKSLQLSFEYDDSLPIRVVGDPDRLAQILFNLVGNSIKFTSTGQILLKVEKVYESVDITSSQTVSILFSVEDTGIGIPKDKINLLFKPFTQFQKTGTSGESGTGLGLSIAQQIVKMMGGEIIAQNSKLGGSLFSFTLNMRLDTTPLSTIQSNNAQLQSKNKAHLEKIKDRHFTVLVVEDNPTNQIVISSMLDKMSIRSIITSDGVEALFTLQTNKFDLILMDCFMPKMDGFETTQRIRDQGITTPILAMTASANTSDERLCYEVGMNGFVTKPITIEALSRHLSPYLDSTTENTALQMNPTLQTLSDKIGVTAAQKVVNIFVKTLTDLQKNLAEDNDLTTLQKLGHKYKSSSQTVGALHLYELCKSLEKAESLPSALAIKDKIQETIPQEAEKLTQNLHDLHPSEL